MNDKPIRRAWALSLALGLGLPRRERYDDVLDAQTTANELRIGKLYRVPTCGRRSFATVNYMRFIIRRIRERSGKIC